MEFSPNNHVVKLCVQGMGCELAGKTEEAGKAFLEAWKDATNDFEKFLSGYFVAKHKPDASEKLEWFNTSLVFAHKMDDDVAVLSALPRLYSNISTCYEELNDPDSALKYSEFAIASVNIPDDLGPFYHGTRANLTTGDLLMPGGMSNYKDELIMNHIYFTALPFGAGLAAHLAKGEGGERVYMIEPTGSFDNDPNVTNKKFPGNLTRSYRSAAPLKIVGEVTDWLRQTPEELRDFRERLSNSNGEIIN